MNQFRKGESTTSRECGSTGPPGTIRPGLGSGLQIGAPAGARQHLESLRLLLAIGQRRDRIVIAACPSRSNPAPTVLFCRYLAWMPSSTTASLKHPKAT